MWLLCMAVTRAGDIHLPIISPCQATLLPFLDPHSTQTTPPRDCSNLRFRVLTQKKLGPVLQHLF